MATIIRRSPVSFPSPAVRTEKRGDWEVALEVEGESEGPWVVDLSHCSRWDVQDGRLDEIDSAGLSIPERPGAVTYSDGLLMGRMNRTQALAWHLDEAPEALPREPAFTDVTEATAFLALIGPGAMAVAERFSNLDFVDPRRTPPFLVQGTFSHVPCRIAVMEGMAQERGLLVAFSRGYARDMVGGLLHVGQALGLRPAGEAAFKVWLE
jgi:hypothetical protein